MSILRFFFFLFDLFFLTFKKQKRIAEVYELKRRVKLEAELSDLKKKIRALQSEKNRIENLIKSFNGNVLVKLRNQIENEKRRFKNLQKEVQTISGAIQRETQSSNYQANQARKEGDAFDKEIKDLEAAIARKKVQHATCEKKLAAEKKRLDEERQDVLDKIHKSEILLLKGLFEGKKAEVMAKSIKIDHQISLYQDAVLKEYDAARVECLNNHMKQWENYRDEELQAVIAALDGKGEEALEKLKNGAAFDELIKLKLPDLELTAPEYGELVLPPRKMVSQSAYSMPMPTPFHGKHQPPPPIFRVPPTGLVTEFATPQRNFSRGSQSAEAHRYRPVGALYSSSGHFLTAVSSPFHPPTKFIVPYSAPPAVTYGNGPYPIGVVLPTFVAANDNGSMRIPKDIPAQNNNRPTTLPASSYPIGTIPPHYICDKDGTWTPPGLRQHESASIFQFPPTDQLNSSSDTE